MGRLEESKGVEYLLKAFSKINLPDTLLIIAGNGSAMKSLRVLSEELKVNNRVRFIGYVPAEDSIPYYALANVFVLPSITLPQGKEPWGLVVNEAFDQESLSS